MAALLITLFPVQRTSGTVLPPVLPTATITLVWDPSPSADIIGYNVYFGTASRTYPNVVSAGNTNSCVITNLTRGEVYYFAVTAVDAEGLESDFSEELIYSPPLTVTPHVTLAQVNGSLSINASGAPGYTYSILASEDMISWTSIGSVQADSSGLVQFIDPEAGNYERRFYRLQQVVP